MLTLASLLRARHHAITSSRPVHCSQCRDNNTPFLTVLEDSKYKPRIIHQQRVLKLLQKMASSLESVGKFRLRQVAERVK